MYPGASSSVLSSHYATEVSALQVSLHFICTYYRRQAKLREGNVFTPVCHFVHRGGGGSLSQHAPQIT